MNISALSEMPIDPSSELIVLVLSYFLTLKFKGSELCLFHLSPVIDSFRKIYGNKLGSLKFNVS